MRKVDRIEAEVIASLVLIGQLELRKMDDYIPEIECRHKANLEGQIYDTSGSCHFVRISTNFRRNFKTVNTRQKLAPG